MLGGVSEHAARLASQTLKSGLSPNRPPRPRRRLRAMGVALVAIAATALVAPAASTAQGSPDSEGTNFWLAFPGNFNGSGQQTLFITGRQATNGNVSIPGLGFSQNFAVTPGDVTSVLLPAGSDLNLQEGVEAKGIHVTADDEVSVYGLNRIQASTDAYLGLPVDVLGTNNIVLGIGTGLGGNSELGIAASEDNTTVTINPSVDGANGHPAGTPYDVTLDRGDAYQLRSAIAQEDLSGTTVDADKPVSVYGGHQCANVPDQNFVACDHVVEQMPPTDTWGTVFGTVPLQTRLNGDTFRFVASEDGTQVRVNGAVAANLDRGEVHQQIIEGQSTITANNPILVGQYSNSSSFDGVTSDPFEMLIPPLEQFLPGYTVTTPATGFATNFINLVVPNSAVGDVGVDGTDVPAGQFTPIGSSGFSGAQVDVDLGAHNLTGGQPFGAFQYGFASFDSYGYAGGQSFAPIARVVSITVEPANATHLVDTEQCVTATVRDQNGTGVPSVRVDFVVTGANDASGFDTANASGQARFCYTGERLGDDTIRASVGQVSGTARKTWVRERPTPPPLEPVTVDCGGVQRTINGRVVNGGDTNETIVGTPENDLLNGGAGDDNIDGIPGDDCINGQDGNDQLAGSDGADRIRGDAGSDAATGGNGDDDIDGATDPDDLDGNDGNDTLVGRGAEDDVSGDTGDDTARGSGGDDTVEGGDDDDRVQGGTDQDHVDGGSGKDLVRGVGGEDKVVGGTGKDTIRAGGGNDKVNSVDGFKDKVKCGLGNDRAKVDDKDVVNDDCNHVSVKES